VIAGVNLRIYHSPSAALIKSRLNEIKVMGATSVAIVPTHYLHLAPGSAQLSFPPPEWGMQWLLFPDLGQDPQHAWQNTTSQDAVYYAAHVAKSMGLDVWIKPHLDPIEGGWRGWVSVPLNLRKDLEWAYRWRFLARYLSMAGELGCGLVIGTELLQFGRDLSAGFWIDIAHWCRRQGFKGPLTYAANWGEEVDQLADLWADPIIDYIGVDAYYPIIEDDDWLPICEHLSRISKAAGDKKILLTEVGYQNAIGTNVQPWGVDCATAVLSDISQAHYCKLMRQSLENQPWFAGYLLWEAERLRTDAGLDACEQKGISHVPTPKTAQLLFGATP
jgi:hypothetical protein